MTEAEWIIGEASASDIPDMVALEEIFPTDRLQRKDFQAAIASQSQFLLVARSAGKFAGYCLVRVRRHLNAGRLFSIAAAQSLQNKGVGTALLKAAEKRCMQLGLRSIYLEVRATDQKAIEFYVNRNYRKAGKYYNFYSDKCDALRMRKQLKEK